MTWAARGRKLAIDQPSEPREELVDYLAASAETVQFAGSWYLRDREAPLDPEAPWWAVVAGGAWYGIVNARAEPFTPFLMLETDQSRKLLRVVSSTSTQAEKGADDIARHERYQRGVWVRDGRIKQPAPHTGEVDAIDAILVTRFEPGGVRSITHALPYALVDGTARIAGPLHS